MKFHLMSLMFIFTLITVAMFILLAGCSAQHYNSKSNLSTAEKESRRPEQVADKIKTIISTSTNTKQFSKLNDKSIISVEVMNQYISASEEKCYSCKINGYQREFLFCKTATGQLIYVRDFEQ